MKQRKPFKTIDEQLDILRGRGLGIQDPDRCAAYILSNNYYSVVNGYKHLLLDPNRTNDENEVYRDGSDLIELVFLHQFDRTLRTATVNSILTAEDRLKASVVYAFSQEHTEQDSYLDPANYALRSEYEKAHGKGSYTKNLIRLLSTLQGLRDGKQRTEYIEHYRKNYGDVPLWVLSNCLTFGNVSAFYDLQRRGIQNKTAKLVAQTTGKDSLKPEQIKNAFRVLVPFRNICAHGERLFCAKAGVRRDLKYRDLVCALGMVLDNREFDTFVDLGIHSTIKPVERSPALLDDIIRSMGFDSKDEIMSITSANRPKF